MSFDAMKATIHEHTSLVLSEQTKAFYVQTGTSDVAGMGRVFQKEDQDIELL
jgi:hypothetical protein